MPRPSAASPSLSPSSSPLPEPSSTTNPFFQEPPELAPSSLPEPAPEPAPSWSSSPAPSSSDSVPAGSSGTPSTGPKPDQKPLGKAQLRKVGETVVQAITGFAHSVLTAPETPEREDGLWLADEKDREVIGGALAGIAARRVPSGVAGPDTPDVVALVVGLVGYVGKQFAKRAELRAARARAQAQQDLWPDGGDVPTEAVA